MTFEPGIVQKEKEKRRLHKIEILLRTEPTNSIYFYSSTIHNLQRDEELVMSKSEREEKRGNGWLHELRWWEVRSNDIKTTIFSSI